jgi:DNA-directed RNA polymerase specialized sigma24 family protein
MNEKVINTITKVVNRIAPGYTFYGYTVNDIKQESFIICMDALDRWDEKRSLENFLAVHLSNRLKNFVRDNHFTSTNDNARINITQPAQLDDEYTIEGGCSSSCNNLHDADMIDIINRELSAVYRMDYLKMLHDVYVPKPRREEIKGVILDILEEHGYEGD